jgi:hypothetical protein
LAEEKRGSNLDLENIALADPVKLKRLAPLGVNDNELPGLGIDSRRNHRHFLLRDNEEEPGG